jgi:hypothetical protein
VLLISSQNVPHFLHTGCSAFTAPAFRSVGISSRTSTNLDASISGVLAREILDSRGNPTVEVSSYSNFSNFALQFQMKR